MRTSRMEGRRSVAVVENARRLSRSCDKVQQDGVENECLSSELRRRFDSSTFMNVILVPTILSADRCILVN